MADEADRAQQDIECLSALHLRAIASRPPEAVAEGACLYCGEVLADGRRWCDADCRDGWERLRASSNRR